MTAAPFSTQWSAPTLEAQALRDEFQAEPDRTHPRLLRRVELFLVVERTWNAREAWVTAEGALFICQQEGRRAQRMPGCAGGRGG